MLFHTWPFVLFFCIVYPVYVISRGRWFEKPWLLLASYIFYASWNPVFLFLIIYSTVVDYVVVARMEASPRRRLWLALGIGNHLCLLGFFKYGSFLVENLNALFHSVAPIWTLPDPHGVLHFTSCITRLLSDCTLPDPNGVLGYVNFLGDRLNHLLAAVGIPCHLAPQTTLLIVGISFYTFQSMSYIIDCYRGIAQRERRFLVYAAYVCFFPQLVAGPIERSGNLLRQLGTRRAIYARDVADGLSLFLVGLFKKVALADFLALYVDQVYGRLADSGAPALILATVAFGWQVYFDFAGYTDMARGIARMMGIRLILNFRNPYLADSLGDFWRRWHISLSTWFRDYVYIPLGGNRKGPLLTHVNMAATMVISGIWHGAAWTFLLWGAVHALGRVATRGLEASRFYRERVPGFARRLWVFAFVTFAWIFFRARSIGDAWLIVKRIFTGAWTDPRCPLLIVGLVLAVWVYQFLHESRARRLLQPAPVRIGIVVFMAVAVALLARSSGKAFIYFEF